MPNNVITKTQQCLERLGLRGSRLVAAVSGGPDSLALTLALADLRATFDLDLHLAHLDHQLRPESAADADFVADVAALLDIPLTVGRADVRGTAEREHLGIEEAARQERYQFLSRVCQVTGAAAVVVAHTADDQTETRLMHWLRGSGLRGLVGMAEDSRLAVAGHTPVRIVRPLLDVRREETEGFCADRGLEPRRDSSNHDLAFTRNYLRYEVLPRLRTINPRLDESIARLARSSSDADDLVQSDLDLRMPSMVRVGAAEWAVDRATWIELPTALKRALLQRAFGALTDTRAMIDAGNVEDGLRAADTWPSGRTLTWPDGVELRVEHDHFLIRRHGALTPAIQAVQLPIADGACVEVVVPQSQSDRNSIGARRPFEPTRPNATAHFADGEVPGPRTTPRSISPTAPEVTSERSPVVAKRVDAERPGAVAARVKLRRRAAPCAKRHADRWHCDLDGAKLAVAGSLLIRARQPGDWLMPAGMSGRKKVQDLLVDACIPREERDQVPVIETPGGIAWVVGVRHDRRFLAGPNCQDVLCITVEPARRAEPVS